METNPRYARVIGLMASYDSAKVGTEARATAGSALDREVSRMSERDILRAAVEYERVVNGH